MLNSLTELVRGWLIEEQVGLISRNELVLRADEQIATLDSPPGFLISVSMSEPLTRVPRLDLVLHPVTDADCAILARCILKKIHGGELDMDAIESIAMKLKQIVQDSERSYVSFDWIAVELHLVREGCKDRESSTQDILSTLEKIAEYPA